MYFIRLSRWDGQGKGFADADVVKGLFLDIEDVIIGTEIRGDLIEAQLFQPFLVSRRRFDSHIG